MASMAERSAGPQALDIIWLDEVSSQVSGPGCGVADLFSWDGAAGADFAAEVESVSRLFPHLDGLPCELTGDGTLGVAEQSAVCGGTSVALGAGGSHLAPGSPADPPLASPGDQCLMSPSDALLASPDPSLGSSPLGSSPPRAELASVGDWKVATGGLQLSEMVDIPAENAAADKITTLIEFFEPARAPVTQPPPTEEIFVSSPDLQMKSTPDIDTTSIQNVTATEGSASCLTELTAASPVEITSPAAFETAAASDSPVIELAESPAIDFLQASVDEEDENARMIDQALEDLKTLENMCGITSDNTTTASASSALIAACLAGEANAVQASAPPVVAAPVAKAPVASDVVKQEPAQQEEAEVEIVEERPAPRRRRRRPPRVAVTPAAAPATQIVIVLTSDQLAGIQQSGQIVLNAAALRPSLAAAESLSFGGKAASKAQKAQARVRAQSKAQAGEAQTVVRPSTAVKAQSSARSATIVKPTSTVTRTITSGAGTSGAGTSGAGTSGAGTSGVGTSGAGTSGASTSGASTSEVEIVARKAVKRPQVIVKQVSAKRAKRIGKRPANAKDPLSGWMEQKLPTAAAGWDLPLLGHDLPLPSDGADIPEDLQDVLLDGTDSGAVPSLPADAADCLLEELISGSVRENPGLFDGVAPPAEDVKPVACPAGPAAMMEEVQPLQPLPQLQPAGVSSPQPLLLAPAPVGYCLSPQSQQQLTLESWVPTLCPSPGEEPVSPASECCSPELAPAPDWQPGPAARRDARRPRPYDKQLVSRGASRRQPLTEDERKERKKEQNKNAATRYRQKKKEEHDLVSGDQDVLEARNKVLRERVGSISRELNYLKQLMREVLRHKQVTA